MRGESMEMDPNRSARHEEISAPGGAEHKVPEMGVRVSADRLTAYLTVKVRQPDEILTEQDVIDFLHGKGITYGICGDSIRDFCENKKYFLELPCARGLAPVDEEDADMEYLFHTDRSGLPVEREDGTVDFHDLGLVQNVKKGDVLCRILPPAEGKPGVDVLGKPIPYKKGRFPSFPSGRNTWISEDGLELSAKIDGCIQYKNLVLNVNEVFIVHGNVGSSSGDISFLGSVIVQGDVMEGFQVKAGGDITVRGMVEGATLEAGGNIAITHGVNGMHGGKLKAGGNISAKYFQNTVLECGGDVCADVIMNSSVAAGYAVILRGPSARLIGGRCRAGRQVYANYIGTDSYVKTDVVIDSQALTQMLAGNAAHAEEIGSLTREAAEQQKRLDVLDRQIETVDSVMKAGSHGERIRLLAQTLAQQQKECENRIRACQEKAEKIKQAPPASTADYNVIGLKIVYSGTKITIGGFVMSVANDYSSMKFYVEKGQVVAGPILPSDRMSY